MSSEIVRATGQELVHPAYGHTIVPENEAIDIVAAERADVVELKRSLDQYASHLDDDLNRRLDAENTRSFTGGGWKIETKAPEITKYPVEVLEAALDDLIAKGKLTENVKAKVLVPQPPKPDGREILKLLKHADQDVRLAILDCGVPEAQRRTVSCKRVDS